MADGSAADKAYQAALREIERVRAAGETTLDLSGDDFSDLDRIPPEVAEIEGLWFLRTVRSQVRDLSPLRGLDQLRDLALDQTAISDLSSLQELTSLRDLQIADTRVSDLSPLLGMTSLHSLTLDHTEVRDLSSLGELSNLKYLSLNRTSISDLTPLRSLRRLRSLSIAHTEVIDLSPLRELTELLGLVISGTGIIDLRPIMNLSLADSKIYTGLVYDNTAASTKDAELRRLSMIRNDGQRTRETLAYLRTLPPWPAPLPWLTNGTASSEPKAPSGAAPVPLPRGLRRITLAEARHILVSDRPQLRARCQHVVAELDDALAIQAVRIPNEPEQLAAHTAITNSLTLAKAALMGLHDALPDDDLDRPVTEAEVTALRAAFDALIEKLKSAAAYVDRSDHTPTYGGILKTGCATAVASVLCLFPGISMAAAIPGVFAMLYGGPAAVKALGEIGKKAGGN